MTIKNTIDYIYKNQKLI